MTPKLIPDIENVVEDLGIPGIAAVVLLPVCIPVLTRVAKPLAKAALKGGIVLYEKGKGIIAGVSESLEDIMAESKAELAEEQMHRLEAAATSSERL